jgi:hypothetical protein
MAQPMLDRSTFRPSLTPDLDRLRKRIFELNWRRPGIRFAGPVREEFLASIEEQMGVSIPSEYRAFLRHVGSGGGGHLGLLSLGDALACMTENKARPDGPFPLTHCVVGGIASPLDGALPIWDHGCGERTFLVLTGAQRGKIWRSWNRGWSPEYRRYQGRRGQHGFLSWLEWWLRSY